MKKFLVIILSILTLSVSGQTMLKPGKDRKGTGGSQPGEISRITNANMLDIFNRADSIIGVLRIKTVAVTVGVDSSATEDFVFTSPANHTAQSLNLDSIVPAKARVIGIEVVCTDSLRSSAGTVDITMAVGNASGGAQFIAALSCDENNEVVGIVDATKPAAVKMNWTADTPIFLTGDPNQNWSTITEGKWKVYVTYIQYN